MLLLLLLLPVGVAAAACSRGRRLEREGKGVAARRHVGADVRVLVGRIHVATRLRMRRSSRAARRALGEPVRGRALARHLDVPLGTDLEEGEEREARGAKSEAQTQAQARALARACVFYRSTCVAHATQPHRLTHCVEVWLHELAVVRGARAVEVGLRVVAAVSGRGGWVEGMGERRGRGVVAAIRASLVDSPSGHPPLRLVLRGTYSRV